MSTFRGRPIVPAPFSLGNEVMEARLRLPPRSTATRLRFNLSLLVLPSSFSFSPSLSLSLCQPLSPPFALHRLFFLLVSRLHSRFKNNRDRIGVVSLFFLISFFFFFYPRQTLSISLLFSFLFQERREIVNYAFFPFRDWVSLSLFSSFFFFGKDRFRLNKIVSV